MRAVRFLLVLLLLTLFTVPFASATMNLYHFSSGSYSLGDVALFNGDVSYSNDIRANLNVVLVCGSNREQVAVEILDLEDNKVNKFSNYITLPVTLSGDCNVELSLVDENGVVLETATFQGFKLTNSLDGKFQVSNNNYQLGEVLHLNGFVTKPNNALIDGVALISFKQNGTTRFLGTGEIIRGALDYSKELIRIPEGEYIATIFVTDNFGNKNTFENVLSVNVDSTLDIILNMQKSSYDPGDDLVVSGYVTSDSNTLISSISLEFNFGSKTSKQNLATNKIPFSTSYHIPENIKTGTYTIEVIAKDKLGNYGYNSASYVVNAIPTTLDLSLEGSSYIPKENVGFSVKLYDQAGDLMSEAVTVAMYDVDGELILTKTVMTDTADGFDVPKQAEPGLWKLSVDGFGLSKETVFTVREHENVDVILDGDDLVVNNNGNIPFKNNLDIEAGDLKKTKSLKLKVGDSERIKLDRLFPDGLYQVRVPSLGKVFDNVKLGEGSSSSGLGNVAGNVVRNLDAPNRKGALFVLLGMFGLLFIYLLFGRRKINKSNKWEFRNLNNDKDYSLGQKKLQELKARGIRKDKPVYGKATQSDIDYWKQKVQDAYQEQENKKTTTDFLNQQQKSIKEDKPRGGLFNMFG